MGRGRRKKLPYPSDLRLADSADAATRCLPARTSKARRADCTMLRAVSSEGAGDEEEKEPIDAVEDMVLEREERNREGGGGRGSSIHGVVHTLFLACS